MTGRKLISTGIASALIVLAGSPLPATATRGQTAHFARALRATDTAYLHRIKRPGSGLIEEGTAHGNLPGTMHADLYLGGTFTATFTIYLHGGTITGNGKAAPHGTGIYESFAGTLTVTGGSGIYKNASGRAGLYGTFNRRTYALVVQTTGALSY
ncbi:MAG TPA: hypothetical protein VHT29_02125 [Solirubrobacteraceae bacterium]|jgi:hypothetical protein|nr:hypothetical protein [Solirubrobacteraceae bacterium]